VIGRKKNCSRAAALQRELARRNSIHADLFLRGDFGRGQLCGLFKAQQAGLDLRILGVEFGSLLFGGQGLLGLVVEELGFRQRVENGGIRSF